jgi:threonine synthase
MSPSMDILISSNLERLLYFVAGAKKTTEYMTALKNTGRYEVSADILAKINETFVGYYADESETAATIRGTFEENAYLADTHTAVALSCADKYLADTASKTPLVVASTASPYKFAADVYASLAGEKPEDELKALDMLSASTKTEIAYPLRDLDKRPVNFDTVIDPKDMLKEVYNYIAK